MIRATPAQTGATIIIIIKLLELGTFRDCESGSWGSTGRDIGRSGI